MLEIRTMAYADYNYPSTMPQNVKVLYDTEEDKVINYLLEGDSYWNTPSEGEFFCPTLKDAKKKFEEYRQSLINRMPEVKKYLFALENMDEDDFLHPMRKEYLPMGIVDKIESQYYAEQRKRYQKKCEYLQEYIISGFLNIAGNSFKPDDVIRVKWYEKKVEIALKDGTVIVSMSAVEKEVLQIILGGNPSYEEYE